MQLILFWLVILWQLTVFLPKYNCYYMAINFVFFQNIIVITWSLLHSCFCPPVNGWQTLCLWYIFSFSYWKISVYCIVESPFKLDMHEVWFIFGINLFAKFEVWTPLFHLHVWCSQVTVYSCIVSAFLWDPVYLYESKLEMILKSTIDFFEDIVLLCYDGSVYLILLWNYSIVPAR